LSLDPPPAPTATTKIDSAQASQAADPNDSVIAILKQLQDQIETKNHQLEQFIDQKLHTFDTRLKTIEQHPPHIISQDDMQSKIVDIVQEANDVSSKIIDLEQTTSDLRQQVIDEVDEIQDGIDDMTKKYEALSIRYPLTTASKPIFTKIPDVPIPKTMAFQLASKTVNVKNLSKELSNIKIKTIQSKLSSRITPGFLKQSTSHAAQYLYSPCSMTNAKFQISTHP